MLHLCKCQLGEDKAGGWEAASHRSGVGWVCSEERSCRAVGRGAWVTPSGEAELLRGSTELALKCVVENLGFR